MKTENGERKAASKRAKATCLNFCSERKPLQAYNVGLNLKPVATPGKGCARLLLDWAFERCPSVRIDTHRDNVIMHHILSNYGFKRCGVIHLANGDPRDAYQKSTENR